MTELGFPEAGDQVEFHLPVIDAHTPKSRLVFKGIVARTEPPEDGWDAGVVVDYPKQRYKGRVGVCVFHQWPNRYLRVAEA